MSMENIQLNPFEENQETQINATDPCDLEWEREKSSDQETQVLPMEEDEAEESLADSMICDSGSRLVPNGFSKPKSLDEVVLFVNAGAMASIELDSGVGIVADKFFQGGDSFETEDFIIEGGECACIYQSARLGSFLYHIENISPGDYFIDLHFAEIININGPKGMRVFNVFIQDEKVLSGFDIFSIVGANKPLQLVDVRVSIKDDGILRLRFEGVHGSPIVSGICIRRANKTLVPQVNRDVFICTNCSSEIQCPSAQKKVLRNKSIAKYEKEIQELRDTLQRKTDECYQSWMSWTTANEQLEKVRMDLDNKTFRTYSLDQTLEKQAEKLRDVTSKYERDQKSWTVALSNFEMKIKKMKQEHSQLSREAHDCVGSIPDLNKMVYAVQSLVEQCEDLKMKYNEEQMMRRKLFNQVQEAKGNIRVFCRCRPLSEREVVAKCSLVVNFDAAKDGELAIISGGPTKKTFKFDRVYTPKDDQVDVFTDAAPMAISVLDGYNVCIFAYGQTGTGKTFTMEGTETNRGVNYRTLEELFKIANERSETYTYSISVSVLEVYNEQIRDLLATETSKKLEIKQASEGSHHIPGIVEAKVENTSEVWNVLQAGSSARAVGSNNVNEHSSRSHCMLCIMVRAKNLISGESTKSKLWLVDLAGSERLAKTDVRGERLKEAQNINRSLSALGDVISALANKSSHIPYRNSKLTHLLQDSLGGDAKTLMFVQISPSDQDLSETMSSLNFATRVRGVELGPVRKQIDTSELQRLKMMLDKERQESKSKDEALKKLEDNLYNLDSKFKGKDQIHKCQMDKIKELESQIELKTSLHCQFQKEISHLSERLNGKEESCSRLQQKVIDLENKLRHGEEIQSSIYQKKVNDLEDKLKEQLKESESSSLVLQQKVDELERKLKEQDQNEEILSLRQKLKELEYKLREQEKQVESINISRFSPIETKQTVREVITNEAEHRVLRSLNSANHQISHGSVPVKVNDDVQEVRKKRLSRNSEVENNSVPNDAIQEARKKRLSRNSEVENNSVPNDAIQEARKKRLSRNSEVENNTAAPTPISDNKIKHLDQPNAFSRLSRPTKPVAQKPLVRNKTSRDPVPAIKERDTKKRMWTR